MANFILWYVMNIKLEIRVVIFMDMTSTDYSGTNSDFEKICEIYPIKNIKCELGTISYKPKVSASKRYDNILSKTRFLNQPKSTKRLTQKFVQKINTNII